MTPATVADTLGFMNSRRLKTTVLAWFDWGPLLVAVGACVGCGDVEFNWQKTGQVRSGPRPGPESPRPGPRAVDVSSVTSAPTASRPAPPSASGDSAAPGDYFQLTLFSEAPPPQTPRGFLHVRLEKGAAADVGAVLSRLYLPVGTQGHTRFLLIYGAQQEWRAAAEFVRLLDVAAGRRLTKPPPADPVEAFHAAVASLMAASRLGAVDRPELSRVAAAFERVVATESAPAELRWAGAMLAADLHVRVTYEYGRAEQLLVAASGIAPSGSVEQMNALYARAQADLMNNRRDRAIPLFAQVVSQFTAFRQSEAYQRSRRAIEAK